jgi:hypothetical protein
MALGRTLASTSFESLPEPAIGADVLRRCSAGLVDA